MAKRDVSRSSDIGSEFQRDRDIHLEEWKSARALLQFFDDKLHDLRKYGFSFVTALLSAEGILLSSDLARGAPVQAKFAVFFVTLMLILALHLIDKNYRVFEKAATTRALVLERKLNIELSEIITDRYRIEQVNGAVIGVYVLFILCVLILAVYTLLGGSGSSIFALGGTPTPDVSTTKGSANSVIYLAILVVFAIAVTAYTIWLDIRFKTEEKEDWTISPLESPIHGEISITVTNLDETSLADRGARWMFWRNYKERLRKPEPIKFVKGEPFWKIISEENGKEVICRVAEEKIHFHDSHAWKVNGAEFQDAGVYQLHPRGRTYPLHRRIVILDNR